MSCSSVELTTTKEEYVPFSRISGDSIQEMAITISRLFDSAEITRSRTVLEISNNALSVQEEEISKICEPLTMSGKAIQSEIINIQQVAPEIIQLVPSEVQAILALTDDQLALIALELNAISEFVAFTESEQEYADITGNLYADCLLDALGISDIYDLCFEGAGIVASGGSVALIIDGTKTIINANTAGKLLCGFAKRYAGWLGVGYMLYEFSMCVKDHAN